MAKRLIAAWGCLCGLAALAAWLPEVPERAVAELGSTHGTPQAKGFVFVEGRYIPPPYTVTRKGNGIFINRIQVDQPVPWISGAADGDSPEGGAPKAADGEAPEGGAPKTADGEAPDGGVPKAADADGDFEEVAPDETPAETAAGTDDLFSDIGKADEKLGDAPQAKEERGPAQGKINKEAWLQGLEKLRKGYDDALGRGEVFFFGPKKRVNGNYGSARTMMGVLPQALRHSQSPQELLRRLREGGVFFIDIGICGELYRNKTTFPLLEERLKKIEETEALEEARRRNAVRRW